MLDNTIAAAQASGARIVLPGTVYNHGPDAFPVLREDSPQRPVTRKGAIRVEMERRLQAAQAQGVRSLVVRAGDFFGPHAANNWFTQGLVKPGRPLTRISNPGRPGIGHQWAYLPDVARTMLELIAREHTLEPFAAFHMRGHWDADGTGFVEAIRRVVVEAGGKPPKVGAFPWWAVVLGSPFVPLFRELGEMRYLWRQPIRMDNSRLLAVLGHEPHTPLDVAIKATLEGIGAWSQQPVPGGSPLASHGG
jgi:nucleoside-diphosphate-sugar epimerase